MINTDVEFLKTQSTEASEKEAQEIVKKLTEALESAHNGIGLSAPQIGILKKVCVIKTDRGIVNLINPRLIKKEEPIIHRNEGCLSFPGVYLDTLRYNKVSYQVAGGGILDFTNLGAIVACHETDHLNGILFFDREIPKDRYKTCPCLSGKKFKFCCWPTLNENA